MSFDHGPYEGWRSIESRTFPGGLFTRTKSCIYKSNTIGRPQDRLRCPMPRQVARDLTNHVPLSGLAATAQLICLELSELERERCYKPCSTHHLLSSTLDILEFLSKYYRSSSIKYCSPTGKETVSVVWFKGTRVFFTFSHRYISHSRVSFKATTTKKTGLWPREWVQYRSRLVTVLLCVLD